MFFDYLDGGTGAELGLATNRQALDAVKLVPRFLGSNSPCSGSTTIFGQRYSIPLGVSPVGVAGFVWPGAELMMARLAGEFCVPFVLSMVATASMEDVFAAAGSNAWLQVYPTQNGEILSDIVRRAKEIGYQVLVATIDSPVISRRDRDIRNGFGTPFGISPRTIWDFAVRPAWLAEVFRNGIPECALFRPYAPRDAGTSFERVAFAESQVQVASYTADGLRRLREMWPGRLVVKGVLSTEDANVSLEAGADGLIISNHGGRQLDAAPASIDALLGLAERFGARSTLMLDSGIRSGLDVVRAVAAGAEMSFSGRTFYYAIAALGAAGGRLAIELLTDEYRRNLAQLGCSPRDALVGSAIVALAIRGAQSDPSTG
ncbi:L-lactate dehydrogenase (cytochrome) [Rhodoligotrophos appendicifer]